MPVLTKFRQAGWVASAKLVLIRSLILCRFFGAHASGSTRRALYVSPMLGTILYDDTHQDLEWRVVCRLIVVTHFVEVDG
jgi:hypothetical protein